ncbi:MAG: thioredoxin family protein [Planctomycetes bacterium]|nr:thioredoxin family protein [Planctomycetota bacterium]
MRFFRFLLPALLWIGLTQAASAAVAPPQAPAALPSFSPPFKGAAKPAFGDSRDAVSAVGEVPKGAVRPGSLVPVAIRVQVKSGWHMWPVESQARALPGASVFESAIFSTLTLQAKAPDAGVLKLQGVQWPAPVGATFDFGEGKQTLAVYEGDFVIFAAVQVAADAANGTHSATAILGFQACTSVCLGPADLEIPFTLQVDSAAPVAATSGIFAPFDPRKLVSDAAGLGDSKSVLFDFFGASFHVDPSGAGFLLLLLVAFLGGMLLNFTPCVLPIIPLKIMSLSQSAGNRRKCFALGFVMSLGVVGFWLALGALVSGVSGFSAANQLFQYPAFTIALGLFIALMAVGMAGFFSVGLPAWVYAIEPKHDSYPGTFVFGIMTAVLSTPCTAPLMGAAAGWAAASGSASTVLVVFGTIGAGMATPYLILSAYPSLVSRMPRTGPASELVKQVMGILLLAAAIFFIGAGVNGLLSTPTHLHWWLIGSIGSLAGLWLLWRTFHITKKKRFRLVFSMVALAMVALSAGISAVLGGSSKTNWIPYSPEAVAAAKAKHQTIVFDFTAEWCLNCKALESAVLDSSEVVTALAQAGVAPIKVDITSRKSDGWNLLHDYDRVSIPLLVVQSADGQVVMKSDAYSSGQVTEAIQSALKASTK